jgi:hypothetical protein
LGNYVLVLVSTHPFFVITKALPTIGDSSYRVGQILPNDMDVDISAIATLVGAIKIDKSVDTRRESRDRSIDNGYNTGFLVGDLRKKLAKCCM